MAISQGRLPMESGSLIEDVENMAQDQMKGLVDKLSEKNNTGKIKSFFKAGINTGEELLNILKEHQPGLVVMYTGGITGIGDRITGTKTDKIIDKTSIPLLLIPAGFKFSPISSIVFSTDNKGSDKTNLAFVMQFAQLLKAHTHILHIQSAGSSPSEFNESLLLKDTAHVSYETKESKDVIDGILDFAKAKESGIIVMSTYTRSFFEKLFSPSLTKNMAYNLQRPLLVLDKD